MATFTAQATGTTTGSATASGLSVVNYARTVYINIGGAQQHEWAIAANATPSSSYTAYFSGLNPSTSYTARVIVYMNSPWREVWNTTASFTTQTPPSPPPTPTNLSSSNITSSSITLNWDASGNVTYFYLYLNGSYQGFVSFSARSYRFTGLSPNTTYTLGVSAYYSVTGLESSRASISRTTLGTVPLPPTGLAQTGRTATSVSFSWDASSGATGYTVWFGSGQTTTTNTSMTINDLTAGSSYNCYVNAYNANGTSDWNSGATFYTSPGAPSISISNLGFTTVDVVVSNVASGGTAYIYAYNSSNTLVQTKTATSNGTVQFTGLVSGATYTFDSRNLWQGGYSVYTSPRLSATTLANTWTWNLNASGQAFNLTAGHWNSFLSFINNKRVSKGLSNYNFTTASTGAIFTASMANEARTAISAMSPPTAVPSAVSSGGIVSRSWLDSLAASANSVT